MEEIKFCILKKNVNFTSNIGKVIEEQYFKSWNYEY